MKLFDGTGVRRVGGHSLRVSGARAVAALELDIVLVQLMERCLHKSHFVMCPKRREDLGHVQRTRLQHFSSFVHRGADLSELN